MFVQQTRTCFQSIQHFERKNSLKGRSLATPVTEHSKSWAIYFSLYVRTFGLWSISSTFYAPIFCMKVLRAAFFCLEFGFEQTFVQKNACVKCSWNWPLRKRFVLRFTTSNRSTIRRHRRRQRPWDQFEKYGTIKDRFDKDCTTCNMTDMVVIWRSSYYNTDSFERKQTQLKSNSILAFFFICK